MLNRQETPNIVNAVDFDLQLKPYRHFTLDNGVPVYSIDAGAQELTQIEFVFYAGNWFEEKGIVAGATNVLLKNGTTNKSAYAINEIADFYGAHLSRGCYNETATVTLHTLNKHLPHLLPLVAEVLSESIFPEEELAIYKQNHKQKLEVNLKKCEFVASRLIDEYVYGFDHPYGRYSSIADYDNLEREQLVQYFKQYYTHGKCMLFVAGKLPVDIEESLNKYFGSLPFNNNALELKKILPAPAVERKYRITNDDNGVQGAIRMARPFFNRHHPDFIGVQILNNIFGGFFGSRLMDNIREDKGYTYGIHSYLQNHIHTSAWMISTEAGRDVCEATIEETYKEMEKLRTAPVEDDELFLVKNFMMGSLLSDLDGPFQTISRWKNYILNGMEADYFNQSIHTIKTITPDTLQELAKKYLNPEEFYELVVI